MGRNQIDSVHLSGVALSAEWVDHASLSPPPPPPARQGTNRGRKYIERHLFEDDGGSAETDWRAAIAGRYAPSTLTPDLARSSIMCIVAAAGDRLELRPGEARPDIEPKNRNPLQTRAMGHG